MADSTLALDVLKADGTAAGSVQLPAALTHRPVPADARPGADLLRLSIGLEDPADLQRDLAQSLSED